ncbi:MAG: invasin domain 3-containing protein [Phycisphaerae bacterium]
MADNVDTELLTVTLLAADGTTPVVGHNVLMAIAAGGSNGVTIGAPSGSSNASGVVTFAVSSSISKVVSFQAIDLTDSIVITQTADVSFTPNITDAGNSTVATVDGTAVANGVETELVTITLLNSLGHPVFGHDVSLAVIAGDAANVNISAPSGPSTMNGVVTFTVTATESKVVTLQATDDTNSVAVTQTVDITFTPNLTDAGTSSVVAADGTAVADGLDTELITVTVRNVAGATLSGRTVSLAVIAGGAANVNISAPSGVSGSDGIVTFTVSATEAKTVTLQATDETDGIVITQTADVIFAPNVTDAGAATVVAADGGAVADGVDTELITVTLLNAANHPLVGHNVSLAVATGGAANVTISAPSGPSDASGVVTFTVSSTEAKAVTFQATDDTDGVVITQTAGVTFTPNITDAGNSTVAAADGSAVADGVETETITVTLRNALGHAVFGHTVSLAVSAGGAANVTISAPSGPSDASGVVTFTVSATESKTVTFQATDVTNSVVVTQTADVDFTPNISHAGNSTLANVDGTAVADGVDAELITVTLRNASGNAVFGHTVLLAVVAGGSANVTINGPSGPTDASGVATFTVSATEAKTVTLRATDVTDGVTVTQTVDVDFTQNVTDAGNSTVTTNDGSAVANGVDTETITVTLLNGLGNPVPGHNVSLAIIAGGATNITIGAPSGPSDASGVVTFAVSSTETKTVTFQATDDTDAVVITQTVVVDFTPNLVDANTSTVVAADGGAVADGLDTELITVTVRNASNDPLLGHTVSLAVIAGGTGGVTVSAPSGASDGSGVVTFTVSSTAVRTITLQATDETDGVVITQTADVAFTANVTDANVATVTAADGAAIADGVDTELITVTVLNAAGNPLAGHNVALAVATGGAANVTIGTASGPSDASGVVTFTVSSTESKSVTFEATDDTDGVTITQTALVDFTPNISDAGNSAVVATDGAAVADGVETEQITVTLRNALGHAVAGHNVSLAVSAGGVANVTISAPSGPSSAAGVVTFTVSATQAKLVTFQATDDTDGVVITQTANVNFTANVTHAGNSTVGNADGTAVADGADVEVITVMLRNAAGHAVFDHDVSLTVIAGGAADVTVSAPSGPSDASGVVTFAVRSITPKTVTLRATDDTNGVVITQTASVTFTPGPPDHLRFVQQPVDTNVATPLAVTVEIVDALDHRVNVSEAITLSLLDANGCGGELKGTPTVNTVAGLGTFGDTQNVTVAPVCDSYRLRASAAGRTSVDSSPFRVSSGPDLLGAAIVINAVATTTTATLTYSITGETVGTFTVLYGLERDTGNGTPLDVPFAGVIVDDVALRCPGVHAIDLGDVRPDLNQAICCGDRLVALLDADDDIREANEDDNTATATLTVDLAIESLVTDIQGGAGTARIVYAVNSPAAVPDFVIRLGLDTDGDGTIDDVFTDTPACDELVQPGPHIVTVDLGNQLLARQIFDGQNVRIVVVLDADNNVAESDDVDNNRRSSTEQGYAALTVDHQGSSTAADIGDEIVCIWRLSNSGNIAAEHVVLTLLVPAEVLFLRAELADGGGLLSAVLQGELAYVQVGTVPAEGELDVAVVLQVLDGGQIDLWAEASTDGSTARSASARIEILAEQATDNEPGGVVVEDKTTTVQFVGPCGFVSLPLLTLSLLGVLGLKTSRRAVRRAASRSCVIASRARPRR